MPSSSDRRTPESQVSRGVFTWVRRFDDFIYSVEQTVVVTFLAAMTLMVFLDVVDRRLSSPDTKLGQLLGRLAGVQSEATQVWIDTQLAPVLGTVLGVGLLWFAVSSVRRPARRAAGKTGLDLQSLGLALLLAAGLATLGWLMTARVQTVDEYGTTVLRRRFPSKHVYLLLYLLAAVPWSVRLLRDRPRGWPRRLLTLALGGALLGYFALTYFPDEYSWALEVSGIMLLWVGALGASICAHAGKHIRLEALQKIVPPKAQRWVAAGGFLVSAFFAATLSFLGYGNLENSIATEMLFEQTRIPDWVATSAIPLAFALTAARFVGAAVSALLGGDYGRPVNDELAAAAAIVADEAEPTMQGQVSS